MGGQVVGAWSSTDGLLWVCRDELMALAMIVLAPPYGAAMFFFFVNALWWR